MDFLADESCDFAIVRALRSKGHDVLAVSAVARGASDEAVASIAIDTGRVLLTEDKDFGRLVFARGRQRLGVILFRFAHPDRAAVTSSALEAVERLGDRLLRAFVVVTPGRVRASFPQAE